MVDIVSRRRQVFFGLLSVNYSRFRTDQFIYEFMCFIVWIQGLVSYFKHTPQCDHQSSGLLWFISAGGQMFSFAV